MKGINHVCFHFTNIVENYFYFSFSAVFPVNGNLSIIRYQSAQSSNFSSQRSRLCSSVL